MIVRKLLGIVVLGLFLITPSQADDIRDFQIEGMSIGDSLLDYFSEKEIKDNYVKWYDDDKFIRAEFKKLKFFKTYGSVGLSYKTNDKKYIIHSLSGIIFFNENIDSCYKKMDELDKELSHLFKDAKKVGPSIMKYDEKYGDSNSKQIFYDFKDGAAAALECIDWAPNMKPWTDNLSVSLDSKEFRKWLREQ